MTTSITYQQANTTDGSYDVRQPLPKPVTVEATEPRRAYIGHPTNVGPAVGNLVGFVASPDSFDVQHMTGLPEDPETIVGTFPVYAEAGGFYTDTRVIERIVSANLSPMANVPRGQ
jgi:hypothetical protein